MNAIATRFVGARVRLATIVVVPLAVLAALPFVGRWEEQSNAATQNARMAAVYRLATSNGLVSGRLYAYRLDWKFDCLVYSAPDEPSSTNALELCFDSEGRLVETIDRRTSEPRFATLREQPSLATLRVPPRRLLEAFVAAGAFRHDPRLAGVSPDRTTLPVGYSDLGAWHFRRRAPRAHGR